MNLSAFYDELDQALMQGHTGQSCAPGCGACCSRPSREIEASVPELRGVAQKLWDSGEAESALERATQAGSEGWCVLFDPEIGSGDFLRGRCRSYGDRPLTCRLFGSGVVRDKNGLPRVLLSAVMKNRDPQLEGRVAQAVAAGITPPEASLWRARLAEVDPDAANRLLPLNLALVQALQAEGLRRRFQSLEVEPSQDERP